MTGTRPKSLGHLKMFDDHRTQYQVKEKITQIMQRFATTLSNLNLAVLHFYAHLFPVQSFSSIFSFISLVYIDFLTQKLEDKHGQALTAKQKQTLTRNQKHHLEGYTIPAGLPVRSSQLSINTKNRLPICTLPEKNYTRIFAPEHPQISGVTFGTHCRRHLQHRIQELSSS